MELPDIEDGAETLGHEIGPVGEGQGHCSFDQVIVDLGQNNCRDDVAKHDADGEATQPHEQELAYRWPEGKAGSVGSRADRQRKHDDGDCIVEQTLAFDQDVEPLLHAERFEERHDCYRVRRRNQGAEGNGSKPGNIDNGADNAGHDERSQHRTADGHRQNDAQVGLELGPRKIQRRLEDQWGHE